MIKNKIKISLIVLTLVGFLFRLKAALNLDVLADDMLYASQSAGIINAGILSTHSNPPLFFYLTDLAYVIFGHTTFASRFWPLVAGTLLIPLIFYLTKILVKDEKIALASAFFVTFSTFLIRMTFTEQTLLVLFFVTTALIFGLNYIKDGKKIWIYLFGVSFGLCALTKYSAPFFFIAFAIFFGYFREKNKENIKGKLDIKGVLVMLGIIIILSLPFLLFNLLIYQQSGIVDVYFSRVINIDKTQQIYQGLAGQGESFFSRLTDFGSYTQYKLPAITDPILTLFSLFGIYLLIRKKDNLVLPFVLIMILIPFILQSGGSALQKHFAFMHLFLAIPAGIALIDVKSRIKNRKIVISLLSVTLFVMILSLGTTYGTPDNFIKKSATSDLKSYLNEKVTENDLIILDSRIYSARNFWLATPNSFILSTQFHEIYNLSANLPSSRLKSTNVFFVECVIDDCGWGWIASNQNLNLTNEQITSVFSSNGILVKSVMAPQHTSQELFNGADEIEVYKVYYLTLNLPPEIISQSKKIQEFYFTPYLYENTGNYLFNYEKEGITWLFDMVGKWIIWLAIILTFLIISWLFWEVSIGRFK